MAISEDEQEELEIALYDAVATYRELVEAAAAAMADRDRLVLRLLFEAEVPQGAVAQSAQISRAQVHRIIANPAYNDYFDG